MAAPKGNQYAKNGNKRGPGKLTKAVKENMLLAFEKTGGLKEFVKWAKENRTTFYQMYAKMAPKEVDATITGDLTVTPVLNVTLSGSKSKTSPETG